MSYLLDATAIRAPGAIREDQTTQYAEQKTLDGSVGRDYFGDSKRVWTLEYENVNPTDYSTIKTIYDSYVATGTTKTWQITEANYTVSSVSVHISLEVRQFSVKGNDYLSDFTLILKEV